MELADLFSQNNRPIKHSHGPRFKSKGGILCFFIAIGVLVGVIVNGLNRDYYSASGLLFLFILLIVYALDIRGIQMDSSSKRIREYKSFMGIRYGEWFLLKDFTIIYLTNDFVTEKYSFGNIHSDKSSVTHHYYILLLVNVNTLKSIFLAEYNNY